MSAHLGATEDFVVNDGDERNAVTEMTTKLLVGHSIGYPDGKRASGQWIEHQQSMDCAAHCRVHERITTKLIISNVPLLAVSDENLIRKQLDRLWPDANSLPERFSQPDEAADHRSQRR